MSGCSTSGRLSSPWAHCCTRNALRHHGMNTGSKLLATPQQALVEALQHLPCRGRGRRRARRLARAVVTAQQTGLSAPGMSSAPSLSELARQSRRKGGGPLPPERSGPSLVKVLYNRLLRRLSSLPLAIGELAVIALLSAIGTIIEQHKGLEYYMENYPDGPDKVAGFVDYHLIQLLQWDHIYTAPYFLALLALLGASLAACTTTRQWPMVRVARRWRFAQAAERVHLQAKEGLAFALPDADVRQLGGILQRKGYKVFLRGPSMYAFKGLAGKLGPIGVHAAMLLVMAGVSFGGLGGYKGTAMVPEGGDFIFSQALSPQSGIARLPGGADSMLRVNSFDIKYREDGSTEQFLSDLSVYDWQGVERLRKTISVNDPLRYKGITAYQTDYSMAALAVKAEGSPLQPADGSPFKLPMASLDGKPGVKGKLWATFIPAEPVSVSPRVQQPRGVSIVARDFQTVALYKADGTFAGIRRPGSNKPIEVEGMSITVEDIIGSTGLELKVDPGVPWVYAGFAGLMITTLVSYLSHSQIWALQEGTWLHVGGTTNRATLSFTNEMEDMLNDVPQLRQAEGAAPQQAGAGGSAQGSAAGQTQNSNAGMQGNGAGRTGNGNGSSQGSGAGQTQNSNGSMQGNGAAQTQIGNGSGQSNGAAQNGSGNGARSKLEETER